MTLNTPAFVTLSMWKGSLESALASRLPPREVCALKNGGAPKRCHNTLSLPSIHDKILYAAHRRRFVVSSSHFNQNASASHVDCKFPYVIAVGRRGGCERVYL
jgi:hypothetical protein